MVLGAALRIAVHDVPEYSRADETVYQLASCRVAEHGVSEYRVLTQDFLRDRSAWGFPPPVRWGFILPGALSFFVAGDCAHSNLGWISTLAGVFALGFTFLIARKLADDRTALLALALSVTSTLQLAMGRRALTEELFCLGVLVAFFALLRMLEAPAPRKRDLALVSVALAFCFSIKETTALLYPAFAALILIERGWRGIKLADLAVFVLPVALHYAVFSLCVGDPKLFFEVYASSMSTVGQEYAVLYQNGPPHRLLVDLLALSPIVWIVAAMGLGVAIEKAPSKSELRLYVPFLIATLAFCFAPSKNVRYIIASDPLVRIVAASVLARWRFGPKAAIAVVLVNAAVEWWLFHAIFLEARVYDPVTLNVLRAIRMLP